MARPGIDGGGVELIAGQRELGKYHDPGGGLAHRLRVDRRIGPHVVRYAARLGHGDGQRPSHAPIPSTGVMTAWCSRFV